MNAIVGIVDLEPRQSLKASLAQMLNSIEDLTHSDHEISATDSACFAVLRPKTYDSQNLVAEDEDKLLAFWGHFSELPNSVEDEETSDNRCRQVAVADLLLKLYTHSGLAALFQLNGRFIIALWDKRAKVLSLVSDRHGFCKLFYWHSSKRFLFSSQYKAIACHPEFSKDIDHTAIADFMALGYTLGERTFFRSIRLLPHASVLSFGPKERLSIDRYQDYSFRGVNEALHDIDYYVDKYYAILRKVLQRQVQTLDAVALPISGGLDSRTIAGMLQSINFKGQVHTFSYGTSNCFDVVYGTRIARRLGYSHTHLPIPNTYLRDASEDFVWLTEGTVNCINAHMMLTHPVVIQHGVNAVITGFLGDTVGGELVFGAEPFTRACDPDSFLRWTFDLQAEIMSPKDTNTYFQPQFLRTLENTTFDAYSSIYSQAPSDSRYFKALYAELILRQRCYTTFNIYAFEGLAEVLAPFVDNEFVDFALKIPEVLAFTRYVQRQMLVRYLPEVASVPWNRTRLPVNASRIRKGLHWRWEKLIRKPMVKATFGRRYARMNDNYLNTDEAIRTGSRDFVVEHIKDNPFLAEYFRMDRIHKMLDEHMSGRRNEYGKITALLTLSLWNKLFVEGDGYSRQFSD